MRTSWRALRVGVGVLALLLVGAGSAPAATYTVTRTDDPIPGPCEPNDCSLREALMQANGTTTVDDVVVVPASAAPYLVQYEMLSLSITDDTEVRGAGATQTVVKGDGESIVFGVSAKATLVGLTITGGKGAIQNNGDLTLRGVSVAGNERLDTTGGIQSNGPLRIESSFLGFNRTPTGSGGTIHANGEVTIVNSTIAQNFSKEGPGGIAGNAAVTITSSAVVSNRSESATAPGLGAFELTVRDSVFADNRNAAGLLNCAGFTKVFLGGNISDDASCGAGATDRPNVSPGLGALDLHGGTTPVYDLLSGSPAIDAASQCPPVDQRGVARPQGAACDSGPFEFVPTPLPIAAPGDKEFFMKVGKKLRLRKGAIRVRLTCPASEVSPPCRGKATVADPPLVFNGPHTLQTRPLRGKFTIQPGKTRWVPLREPRGRTKRLPDGPGKWKVAVVVIAEDGAGNDWKFLKKKAPLIGAKPKRG